MWNRIRAAAAAAALCLFVPGCGGGGSVTGTVTLDGVPLTSGAVTFHPTGTGAAAMGSIGPDGKYQLSVGTDKSVPPGEYVVTVESSEQPPPPEQSKAANKKPPPPPKRLTPDKYANKATSDLKVTVKSGTNVIPLELKSDPQPKKGK